MDRNVASRTEASPSNSGPGPPGATERLRSTRPETHPRHLGRISRSVAHLEYALRVLLNKPIPIRKFTISSCNGAVLPQRMWGHLLGSRINRRRMNPEKIATSYVAFRFGPAASRPPARSIAPKVGITVPIGVAAMRRPTQDRKTDRRPRQRIIEVTGAAGLAKAHGVGPHLILSRSTRFASPLARFVPRLLFGARARWIAGPSRTKWPEWKSRRPRWAAGQRANRVDRRRSQLGSQTERIHSGSQSNRLTILTDHPIVVLQHRQCRMLLITAILA